MIDLHSYRKMIRVAGTAGTSSSHNLNQHTYPGVGKRIANFAF
jgi:hypothetical protein